MHSFQNRHMYPLKGCIVIYIVSTHRLSCPARPVFPPPLLHLDQPQAPTYLKPLPSSHRLFGLQDSLHKAFPSTQILSPSNTGFIVSAHGLTNITLLALIALELQEEESPTYILNEDTQPVIRVIGVSHTACQDEFRQNLLSHSRSVFFFYNRNSNLKFLAVKIVSVVVAYCIYEK